jgi:hypothetical protein
MPTKYLQLRVHGLECQKRTENRQNFLGIPLETDPDAIDIAAIVTDPAHGLVAQAPPVYLGNRYNTGTNERFATPKVIAEVPINDTDPFPRRVVVTLNMAEKDDGAGFDDLTERVAEELAGALRDEIGGALDREITDSAYYGIVEDAVSGVIRGLFSEIGNLLGLGDDPFRPVTIEHEMRTASDAPSGTRTATLLEPNPAHHGKYVLTYGWHLSDRSAMSGSVAGTGTTGASSEALSRTGYNSAPYPRPFRSFRFSRPMRKNIAVPTVVVRKPVAKAAAARPPLWWYPSVIRPLGQPAKK